MNTQNTPGKWKVKKSPYRYDNRYWVGPDNHPLRFIVFSFGTEPDEYAEADANLVAASKDLLRACEALLELAVWASGAPVFNPGGEAREGWLNVCSAIDDGYAALAKAGGQNE